MRKISRKIGQISFQQNLFRKREAPSWILKITCKKSLIAPISFFEIIDLKKIAIRETDVSNFMDSL